MRNLKLLLSIIYFIIPHHILVNDGQQTIIKGYDFVALIILLVAIMDGKILYIKPLMIYIGYSLVRSVLAFNNIGIDSMLYPIKLLEYAIVVSIVLSLDFERIKLLIKIYILFILFYSLCEISGFKIGLIWEGRISAQFGGPYELSGVLLLIFMILENKYVKLLLFPVFVLTKTKAAYLTLIYYIFIKYFQRNFIYLISALGVVLFFLMIDERFITFTVSLKEVMDSSVYSKIWNEIPDFTTNREYINIWQKRESYWDEYGKIDLSTHNRLHTYLLVVKGLSQEFLYIIFGRGSGFYGTAIDSSLLRIVGEGGLIALYLVFNVFKYFTVGYKHKNSHIILLFLIILFSDVFYSAKFLVTLVLLNRYMLLKSDRNKELI